jgi:hypothetical protein
MLQNGLINRGTSRSPSGTFACRSPTLGLTQYRTDGLQGVCHGGPGVGYRAYQIHLGLLGSPRIQEALDELQLAFGPSEVCPHLFQGHPVVVL